MFYPFSKARHHHARYMVRRTDGYLVANKGKEDVFSQKLFPASSLLVLSRAVSPRASFHPLLCFFWPLGLVVDTPASSSPKRRSGRESSAVPFYPGR